MDRLDLEDVMDIAREVAAELFKMYPELTRSRDGMARFIRLESVDIEEKDLVAFYAMLRNVGERHLSPVLIEVFDVSSAEIKSLSRELWNRRIDFKVIDSKFRIIGESYPLGVY